MLVSWIQALHTVHYGTGTTREGGVPRLTLTGIRFLLTSAIGQNPPLGLGPPPASLVGVATAAFVFCFPT